MILLQKRKEVLKDINKEIETTAIKDGNLTIRSKKQLSQIIDTTLLKCYLQVPQNTSDNIDTTLLKCYLQVPQNTSYIIDTTLFKCYLQVPHNT